jgi:hypothetical protein
VKPPLEEVEGVIAFCDLTDPWGNQLSLYQVLTQDEPPAAQDPTATNP